MVPTRRLRALTLALSVGVVCAAGSAALTSGIWSALVLLLLLAAFDGRWVLLEPAPSIQCELPPRVQLGQSFAVRYLFGNLGRRTQSVVLLDPRPDDLGGDLLVGPVVVPAGGSEARSSTWTCARRGLRPVEPIQVRVRSPLGLFERKTRARLEADPLKVFPDSGATSAALRSRGADIGQRPDRRRGAGMELDTLRQYVLGDDPRHVDWRATARAQRMMVRTFRDERNYALVVAVDSGRLMGAECAGLRKLDHALNASVSLAEACLSHGDRIGFAAFDDQVRSWLPVVDPRVGLKGLLEATLPVEPSAVETRFKALSETLDARQRKRSLIIIFSDFVESVDALELQGYLVHLARRHVVLLVALRDPILDEAEEPKPNLNEPDIYRRVVLQDIVDARETFLRALTRLGVHTMDLRPEQVRAQVLSRYLALRGLL